MLENVVEKIKSKYGTNYKFGQSSHAIYQVGGTLTDWVYSELNVTRTFLLELKSLYDDDEKGFDHFQPPIGNSNFWFKISPLDGTCLKAS